MPLHNAVVSSNNDAGLSLSPTLDARLWVQDYPPRARVIEPFTQVLAGKGISAFTAYDVDAAIQSSHLSLVKTARAPDVPKMEQFIAETLSQFQSGKINFRDATERLLRESLAARGRKARSNRRLRSLCSALQRSRSPVKVRQLKGKLSDEFYYGDQAA